VQRSLFEYFVNVLVERGSTKEQAVIDAQRFVSIPSEDPTRPPPHSTGAAVDLTIIRFEDRPWREMKKLTTLVRMKETPRNWKAIYEAEMRRQQLVRFSTVAPMGTTFDQVLEQTATRYFEEARSLGDCGMVARNYRRMLFNVMRMAGFSNYDEEWWHYQCKNQFHAKITGEPALYGRAVFSDDNRRHENVRQRHYQGSIRIVERSHPQQQGKVPTNELFPFVAAVATKTGHLRHTTHPSAAAI
jgi:D-alanyl-D-alanine dipeptidase